MNLREHEENLARLQKASMTKGNDDIEFHFPLSHHREKREEKEPPWRWVLFFVVGSLCGFWAGIGVGLWMGGVK